MRTIRKVWRVYRIADAAYTAQAELGRAENMLSLAGVSTLSDVSLVPAINVLNCVCLLVCS